MITYGEVIKINEFKNICYQGTTYLRYYEVIYGEIEVVKEETTNDMCVKETDYEIKAVTENVVIREITKIIGVNKRTTGFYVYNNGEWVYISPREIN